jgi:hypothetical protein
VVVVVEGAFSNYREENENTKNSKSFLQLYRYCP